MAFDIDPAYKEVPERIADLKKVHPDAVLRPVNPDKPFDIVTINERTFIVYSAACYRTPDDPLPAIGTAWEPFPGRTPYTKDSELMNAETSAWGRAIVAALRSESKAIASANEVRNRKADQEHADTAPKTTTRRPPPRRADPETGEVKTGGVTEPQLRYIKKLVADIDLPPETVVVLASTSAKREVAAVEDLTAAEASAFIDSLKGDA